MIGRHMDGPLTSEEHLDMLLDSWERSLEAAQRAHAWAFTQILEAGVSQTSAALMARTRIESCQKIIADLKDLKQALQIDKYHRLLDACEITPQQFEEAIRRAEKGR